MISEVFLMKKNFSKIPNFRIPADLIAAQTQLQSGLKYSAYGMLAYTTACPQLMLSR